MSAILRKDPNSHIYELHVSGVLSRAEFGNCEAELSAHIAEGGRPAVLVILEDFAGWGQGGDWANLEFMFTHGGKISRIAIVGAGAKEGEVKAFTGAGIRPSPVRFFAVGETAEARAWLVE